MRTGPSAFQAIVSLEMSLQYGASTSSQLQDSRLNLRRHLPVHEPPTHEGDEGVVEAGEAGIEDPTFDDYDTAPPLLNAPSPSGTYTFGANGVLQKEKMWSRWIDRGLRLIPGFHIAFSKTQAIPYLQEQSLGTGESQPDSSPWTHSSDETSSDVERRSENEGTILQGLDNGPSTSLEPGQGITGLVDLGLREMLDEAGPQADAAHSQSVFLKGIARSGSYIRICPEKDSVAVDPSLIVRKTDIDSLIWVGRHLQFRSACNVHLTPVHSHAPPFAKSNHVFVRLLLPPTQAQWDDGQLSGESKCFNLSQIPHMQFGHIGEGETRFNVIICFPRMTFKPVGSKHMQTLIPPVVQEVWLTNCLIAALLDTFGAQYPGTMEYIPRSVEELRLKSGEDRRAHTIALSPPALSSLQDTLHTKVKENPRLLSRFGSFFFVVDSRGFKILSKQHAWNAEAAVILRQMLPSLDFDYMMDRHKGELFLDMGVSYHVEGHIGESLVGLWKLPDLQETYQMVGFQKPIKHHTNTLLSLGGLQAKMRKKQSVAHHILSRLSYNLVFQVIRSPSTKEYVCSVNDAIKGDGKFVRGCDNWTRLFSGASQQAYGVRDEIRGGAGAILNILDASRVEVISLLLYIVASCSMDSSGITRQAAQRHTMAAIPNLLCMDIKATHRAQKYTAEDRNCQAFESWPSELFDGAFDTTRDDYSTAKKIIYERHANGCWFFWHCWSIWDVLSPWTKFGDIGGGGCCFIGSTRSYSNV
jgi:hypothetical protein